MTLVQSVFFPKIIRIPLLILSCFLCFFGNAQKDKDSLLTELKAYELNQNVTFEDTVYVDLLNNLGKKLRFYQNDSLLLLSQKALKIGKSLNYKKGEGYALYNLGTYYSDNGNIDTAISYYQKSLGIAKAITDKKLILQVHSRLSREHEYNGDYARALNGYLEGIEQAKIYNDKAMLSILNENIALLYYSLKNYDEALEFSKKVKKINEEIGNEVYIAETSSNIATIYVAMGELEYAMYNVNISISIFEKLKIYDWLAYAYETKGNVYLKYEKYEWALHWFKQSEMLHKNLEDERAIIKVFQGISEAHMGINEYNIAKSYAFKAHNIARKLKLKEDIQYSSNILYKIYKNEGDYNTALNYIETSQKFSDTLAKAKNEKSLILLKTKLEYDEERKELILENEKARAKQNYYIYAAILVLLILLFITLLIRRNEKVQKNLNTKLTANKINLEKSEQKLKETNDTKDKLFSIIGHDLRGPIGAFQGLLKLFKDKEISQKEFLNFIPKLGSDLDHISFTLNNLLSWGQSQMNGTITKPALISLDYLVDSNIQLLSEIATNKSIRIVSQLSDNTVVWSDSDQIDIVVRNLISNALKFTPENGMVTIGATEKTDYWQIFVKDTGIGMNKEVKNSIFSDNSNLTTYGTNNEKGTGLGLSLCKEMIENNSGTIWVDSAVQKGSCFYFTLPKAKKKYQKAS